MKPLHSLLAPLFKNRGFYIKIHTSICLLPHARGQIQVYTNTGSCRSYLPPSYTSRPRFLAWAKGKKKTSKCPMVMWISLGQQLAEAEQRGLSCIWAQAFPFAPDPTMCVQVCSHLLFHVSQSLMCTKLAGDSVKMLTCIQESTFLFLLFVLCA